MDQQAHAVVTNKVSKIAAPWLTVCVVEAVFAARIPTLATMSALNALALREILQ